MAENPQTRQKRANYRNVSEFSVHLKQVIDVAMTGSRCLQLEEVGTARRFLGREQLVRGTTDHFDLNNNNTIQDQ